MRSKSPANRRRVEAERLGRLGEVWAALYLFVCGYRVLERRFKCAVGEIDLVARKGDYLVFAEVKTRSGSKDLGDALAGVNARRISRAAALYLTVHPEVARLSIRFDVIFLAHWRRPLHLKGAFDALGAA